jgi:hypothetical protein
LDSRRRTGNRQPSIRSAHNERPGAGVVEDPDAVKDLAAKLFSGGPGAAVEESGVGAATSDGHVQRVDDEF